MPHKHGSAQSLDMEQRKHRQRVKQLQHMVDADENLAVTPCCVSGTMAHLLQVGHLSLESRSGDWTHLLLSWSKDTNSQDVCTNDRDDSRTDTADEATRQHRGRQLMPQLKRSGADVVAAQQVQHLTSHGCVCSEITCACSGSSGVL